MSPFPLHEVARTGLDRRIDPGMSWRELIRRLMVHARCLGATLEEAEDVVHEAVTMVVRDPDWFDPGRGTLLGALKVVVRNRWSNRRRAAGVRVRAQPRLRVVDAPVETPEVPLDRAEARDHRRRLLALLEPEQRECDRHEQQDRR